MLRTPLAAAAFLGLSLAAPAASALSLTDVWVQRAPDGRYLVNWRESGPVDVYVSADADAAPQAMRLAADHDADGHAEIAVGPIARPYFLLKSETTGQTLRVAERLLPLEGGSNFRDLGGYQSRDGRHVKWGLLYRSGAMGSLTDADYAYLDKLGVKVICDLRTAEEREMLPTKWHVAHPPRDANVAYRAEQLFGPKGPGSVANGASNLYKTGPVMLKAQYRQLFDSLAAGEVPLTYNCSAGQDRTGIASALILSALGVPRNVIYQDYHLSTEYRRPANERGNVEYASSAPTNAMAKMFLRLGSQPGADRPTPLYTANGESYLAATFAELDRTYGSVEAYLDKELGMDAAELEKLKAMYLE